MQRKFISLLLLTILFGVTLPLSIQSQTEQTNDAKVVVESQSKEAINAKLLAYFFHGRKQCMSCRTIEAYAYDAIEKNFKNQLESGRIEWSKVNYDNPDFSHFKKDFELYTQSVVLVEMKDDQIIRWKNLKDVWTLIRDKEKFYNYIRTEVQAYLTTE